MLLLSSTHNIWNVYVDNCLCYTTGYAFLLFRDEIAVQRLVDVAVV